MYLSEEAKLENLRYLTENFEVWSPHCARILTKSGKTVPFEWNRAQRYIHERLEQQRREIGYVRALILKGRQQGCSTLIAARFYHRASTTPGEHAFIVAHEDKATTNLFNMVKRYHAHNPIAPSTKHSNAQELVFGSLDSGYKLATAGSKDVGRSNTARLFHGSEFGFWANAQSHLAGIGNTIPSGSEGFGTEIVLESTANGMGNAFHEMWQDAVAGLSEYIAIFVPWFWQPEYRTPPRPDLELSDDDKKYMAAYGLDMAQMQWRANKIREYGRGYEWLFDQEYPAAPELAFKTPTGKPLISPTLVSAAANSDYRIFDQNAPLIIGCDPASDGEDPTADRDRTAIVFRRGRIAFRCEAYKDLDSMQVAAMLARYNDEHKPDAIIVDKGGIGAGIVSRLHELNVPVIGVMFGGGPVMERDPQRPLHVNRRAEMWWAMKEWLEDQPCRIPPSVGNGAALAADLSGPQDADRSDRKRLLESKKDMKKRGLRSPDLGDALALTFAEPVQKRQDQLGVEYAGPATRAGY